MARTEIPTRSPTLWLLVAMAMLAPLDMPPIGPALPVIAETFGVSSTRAGLVNAAYALPGAFAAPMIGVLADRYGRKRVLVPCLLGFGAAGMAVALAPSFVVVLALRAVQGLLGGSIFASLSYTVIGDRFSGPQRNAVMGLTTAGVSITIAVGPVLGGFLAEFAWWGPFMLYAASVLVGVAVLAWFESAPTTVALGETSDVSYVREAVRALPLTRAAAVYGVTFLAYMFLFGGVLVGVPFLLAETYGLSPSRIGILLTVSTLLAAVVAALNGRFARYVSDEGLMSLSFLGYGSGLGLLWLSGSPLGVAVGVVAFGVGHGLFQPSVAAVLSSLGPERFRGGVLSLRTSVLLAAGAAGPPAFTAPAALVGYPVLFLVAGVVALACGAGGLLLVDVRR